MPNGRGSGYSSLSDTTCLGMKSIVPLGPRRQGAPLACVVCGAPLRHAVFGGARFAAAMAGEAAEPALAFCDAPTCRFVASRQPSMRPEQFDFWLAQQVRCARGRAALLRADAEVLERKQAREAAENAARWTAIEETRLDAPDTASDDGREARVAVPSGPRRLGNLPHSRRSRYRDHLTRLITEAVTGVDVSAAAPGEATADADPDAAAIDALAGQLCAVCAGGCCRSGGTTAYLTAATLRRFMRANPSLRPRQVLDAYLDRLQGKTEVGSCVNHAVTGCSLPREMRADICNRYLCDPQRELRAHGAQGRPALSAVVIVRRQSQWTRDDITRANPIIATARMTAAAITWLTTEGITLGSERRPLHLPPATAHRRLPDDDQVAE